MSDSGQNIPVTVMANDFATRRMKQVAQARLAAAAKKPAPQPKPQPKK